MTNGKRLPLTQRLREAINIACRLHLNQVRKADEGLPYISHPFSVAWILSSYTDDEDTVISGLLHDILEDVPGYYYSNLQKDFGTEVADIVREMSEDKDPNVASNDVATWVYRKEKYLEGLQRHSEKALMVCAADKIHNLQSMIESHQKQGDSMWDKFNAPADRRIWFYEEILKILQRRLHNDIVGDYEKELQRMKDCLGQ
jgi:(p)ppGpp synthase/HD superfamily hydrolase